MTYDTTKDPRIIVANLACALLKKCVKQKPVAPLKISRDKLSQLAAACESAVMTMMYMYQEPEALVSLPPVSNLTEAAKAIADAYEKLLSAADDQSLLRANVRWCLRTLEGLAQRLSNPGATLASGVDLVVVQVRNAVKMEKGSNLSKTRVTDGAAAYTVVTNLTDIAVHLRPAAAFLPPREIGGTVSEAMFLGSGNRTETPGTILSEEQVDAKEAASILYEEVAKHH
jgi:predicted RNA-binding protein with EMAP domain